MEGAQPGKPIRKSWKVGKVKLPIARPGKCQFCRSRSYSNPVRMVCFPCDQETVSAASQDVFHLSVARLREAPYLNNPVTVVPSKKFTLGITGVIPTCVSVNAIRFSGVPT